MITRGDFLSACGVALALHVVLILAATSDGRQVGGATAVGGTATSHAMTFASGAAAALVDSWADAPDPSATTEPPTKPAVEQAVTQTSTAHDAPNAPDADKAPSATAEVAPADQAPSQDWRTAPPETPIQSSSSQASLRVARFADVSPPKPSRPNLDAAVEATPQPKRRPAPPTKSKGAPPQSGKDAVEPSADPSITRSASPAAPPALAEGAATSGASEIANIVSGAQKASAMRRWGDAIHSAVARAKRYPNRSRRRGEEGVAPIWLVVANDGALVSARLLSGGSGNRRLDKAAMEAVRDASPFDPAPAEVGPGPHRFKIGVKFRIR